VENDLMVEDANNLFLIDGFLIDAIILFIY
jgi:hypothetical protein